MPLKLILLLWFQRQQIQAAYSVQLHWVSADRRCPGQVDDRSCRRLAGTWSLTSRCCPTTTRNSKAWTRYAYAHYNTTQVVEAIVVKFELCELCSWLELYSRLNIRKHFFTGKMVALWNNLENGVIKFSSLKLFKHSLLLCNFPNTLVLLMYSVIVVFSL